MSRQMGRWGAAVLAVALVVGSAVLAQPAHAATFEVTTTADSGPGSLADAIAQANASPGNDILTFNISGPGPHTIQLPGPAVGTSAFPAITEAVTIDGTTQPGYAGGVPDIQIVEANEPSSRSAFRVETGASISVNGLSFVGFGIGVHILSGAAASSVANSQFGMTPDGNGITGQQLNEGVRIEGGSGHTVTNNYLSNVSRGVLLTGSNITSTSIVGNTIGLSRDETTGLAVNVGIELLSTGSFNQLDSNRIVGTNATTTAGISVSGAFQLAVTSNLVGLASPGGGAFPAGIDGMSFTDGGSFTTFQQNEIAGAQSAGIRLNSAANVFQSTFFNNVIRDNGGDGIEATGVGKLRTLVYGNSIYDNGGLGIDTGANGVDAAPTGGPQISAAVADPVDGTVTVSYDGPASAANKSVQVGLWTNSSCDGSGSGEGETPLAYKTGLTLNASGDLPPTALSLGVPLADGDLVTAIVDGGDVDFTEFSNCFTATGAPTDADLSMSDLTDTPDPVTATGVVAYTAQVQNLGPNAASNPVIEFADVGTNQLPSGLSFVGGNVTSTLGGSGTCTQAAPGDMVVCSLGAGSIPADAGNTWSATVYLGTSALTPASITLEARAEANETDPTADNVLTETTTVDPFGDDSTTEFVPPSNQTETVATAATVLVAGEEVPIAQPGDTTAAAIAVPPGGPGGTVTVAEFNCEPPFCAGALRTVVPTPATPPFDNRVVQFIPPTASFYDYQHPVRYTITYDATVVGSVRTRTVKALYTKDSDPGTLYQAARCPTTLTAATEFPCLQSAKVLKGKSSPLKGDLVLVLLGTYNDPKIAGFR